LPDKPGSPEFINAYDDAVKTRRAPPEGVLQTIIDGYQRSTDFTDRRDRTRSDYVKQIRIIEQEFGNFPLAALTDRRTRGLVASWLISSPTAPRSWNLSLCAMIDSRGGVELCDRDNGALPSQSRCSVSAQSQAHGLSEITATASP
jgi:hypothetical protein